MTIGDINSTARGSGARYNDGKPPLQYIPARILCSLVQGSPGTPYSEEAAEYLYCLREFEEHRAIDALCDIISLATPAAAARVFEYGARKYAPWNWAKGMPWSVPNACIKRHALALAAGEVNDPESGLPHAGHIACNAIMLLHYTVHYKEGDDLMAASTWTAPSTEEVEEYLDRLNKHWEGKRADAAASTLINAMHSREAQYNEDHCIRG